MSLEERIPTAAEIGPCTYLNHSERYVVSLVASYPEAQSDDDDGVVGPLHALAAAIRLTEDSGSGDTQWNVYDRETGELWTIEQGEVYRAGADLEIPDIDDNALWREIEKARQ
jgi:hypothetical protein